jgi:hypothetical protein
LLLQLDSPLSAAHCYYKIIVVSLSRWRRREINAMRGEKGVDNNK